MLASLLDFPQLILSIVALLLMTASAPAFIICHAELQACMTKSLLRFEPAGKHTDDKLVSLRDNWRHLSGRPLPLHGGCISNMVAGTHLMQYSAASAACHSKRPPPATVELMRCRGCDKCEMVSLPPSISASHLPVKQLIGSTSDSQFFGLSCRHRRTAMGTNQIELQALMKLPQRHG